MPYLVLDLETWPREDAEQYMERCTAAPDHYKNPEAIAKYIAETNARRLDKLATDVDLARIACLGWGISEQGFPFHGMACRSEDDERLSLVWLFKDWHTVNRHADARVVTFDGLTFDLPIISRRAEALGVEVPDTWPPIERYRSPRHIDLAQVLSFNGLVKEKKLVTYCALRGIVIDDPLPEGGADVGQAISEGRWQDVVAHCRADVERTRRLAEAVLGWARQPEEVAK